MKLLKYGLVLLLILVAANSFWWSKAIVYDGAPDEYAHIKIPKFYIDYGRLPVFLRDPGMAKDCRPNGIDCGTSYSTLANYGYLINALAMKFVPSSWMSEDYMRGRVGSILMAVAFILVAWKVTKLIFPKDNLLFLTTMVVLASIPMFTFLGSYVNSDIAGILSNILVFWFCWEVINRDKMNLKLLILGGVATGLVLLSRINEYPVLVLLPWVFLVRWWTRKLPFKSVFLEAVLVCLVAFIVSGWWFIRNWVLYGDPTGGFVIWKLWWSFSTRLNPRQMGLSPLVLLFGHVYGQNWLWSSFASFFGSFGYMAIWFPKWVYLAVVGLMVGAGLGVVRRFKKVVRNWRSEAKAKLLFWTGVGGVVLTTLLLSGWTSWTNGFQPQGRYWFAFYYPYVVGLVYGFTSLFPGRGWKIFSSSFLVTFFILTNIWGRQLIVINGGGFRP